jgi:hypothetical protein
VPFDRAELGEITDAAMSHRAECVMLNKGPQFRLAVSILDNILRRMESHQSKKAVDARELRLAHRLGVATQVLPAGGMQTTGAG